MRLKAHLVSVVSLAWTSSLGKDVKTVSTSVCQLSSYPQRFNGQWVSVRALVFSDGLENEGLTDESCEARGVAVEYMGGVGRNAGLRALN